MTALPISIVNFLTAMQAGRPGLATLVAAFTEDAVYVEPFSGTPQRHEGREAVIAAIARGWDYPLPDIHIRVDQVEVTRDAVVLSWTCLSPGLPGGQGSGRNIYRMRGERIAYLETQLDLVEREG
jgi:hypothetical protein